MDKPIASAAAMQIHPRAMAHLGDSVYELWIRQVAIQCCAQQVDALHRFSTLRAQASFQVALLRWLTPKLNEAELEIVRRARNIATPTSRRKAQALHRQATGFEALVGYWFMADAARLDEARQWIHPFLVSGEIPATEETSSLYIEEDEADGE